MINQEKTFFKACYRLTCISMWTVREVVELLVDTIPRDDCWNYLRKWKKLGFYNYGSSIDLGRIDTHKVTDEYKEAILEVY